MRELNVQSNLPEYVYSNDHLPEWPASLLTPQSEDLPLFWGADTGSLSPSFLLCAVSLYPVKETLQQVLEEEKKGERGQGPVGLRQGQSREARPQTREKAESPSPRGGHPEPEPASTVGDPSWTQPPNILLS